MNMMLNATSGTQSASWNWKKQWLQRASYSSSSPQRQPPPSKTNTSQSGSPRGLLPSDHCTGNSAVMPTPASKHRMRTNTRRYASDCADMKTSAKLEKGLRMGQDCRSSRTRWHSEHSPDVGRVPALRKCLVRGMSLKTREGGSQFWKQRFGNSYYIHFTQRVWPASGTQYGMVQESQVTEG